MAGLFAAEAPSYIGQGQNPAAGKGGLFGIFPSTPTYETPVPVPASAPANEAIQLKIAVPGVVSAEVTITIPPSIVAKLPEMVPDVRAVLDAIRDFSCAQRAQEKRRTESEVGPEPEDEPRRSEIEESVWDRE